jgi:hypothetical protein
MIRFSSETCWQASSQIHGEGKKEPRAWWKLGSLAPGRIWICDYCSRTQRHAGPYGGPLPEVGVNRKITASAPSRGEKSTEYLPRISSSLGPSIEHRLRADEPGQLHRSASVCKRTGVNVTFVNVLRRCCCCAFSYPRLNQFSKETLCPFHKRQPIRKAGFQ